MVSHVRTGARRGRTRKAVATFASVAMLLAVTGGAPASQGALAWTACQLGTPWPLPPIARIQARPGGGATAPWCRIISGRRSCVPRAPWVVRENRRPGTSSWCIPIGAPDEWIAVRREPSSD